MLRFFEDYCNQLFPSIDTEVKNAVRDAVMQMNMIADFSQSESFNRDVIIEALNRKIIKREVSLTQFACYMLYTKLTIYYMRIENHEWFETRKKGI